MLQEQQQLVTEWIGLKDTIELAIFKIYKDGKTLPALADHNQVLDGISHTIKKISNEELTESQIFSYRDAFKKIASAYNIQITYPSNMGQSHPPKVTISIDGMPINPREPRQLSNVVTKRPLMITIRSLIFSGRNIFLFACACMIGGLILVVISLSSMSIATSIGQMLNVAKLGAWGFGIAFIGFILFRATTTSE